MKLFDIMEDRLKNARQGYRAFQRFRKKFPADRYLLFRDIRLSKTAIDYFDDYAKMFPHATVFVLLFTTEEQQLYAKNRIKTKIQCMVASKELQNNILDAYALCNLSRWLTVVSLTEPYDTGAWRLLGKKGVGLEELVCFDIYEMDAVPLRMHLGTCGENT